MRTLKSYEVFQQIPAVQTRISVQRAGQWTFATIPEDSFARKTKTQRFYLINESFGLCLSNQNNPRKRYSRGLPGDYIAADPDGNLTIVTAADYARQFPKDRPSGMTPAPSSDDFLRESSQRSSSGTSNSSTTNLPSTGGSANARSGNTRTSY